MMCIQWPLWKRIFSYTNMFYLENFPYSCERENSFRVWQFGSLSDWSINIEQESESEEEKDIIFTTNCLCETHIYHVDINSYLLMMLVLKPWRKAICLNAFQIIGELSMERRNRSSKPSPHCDLSEKIIGWTTESSGQKISSKYSCSKYSFMSPWENTIIYFV